MDKIRDALAAIAAALNLNRPLLARAQRRYKARRRGAYRAHAQAIAAQHAADVARAGQNIARATRKDKKAQRLHARAYKQHVRAQVWLGRIKKLTQRIEGLEVRQDNLAAELKAMEGKVTISGNKATGGTVRDRIVALALKSVANCASGRRANFYSQLGSWDCEHPITGERYGERSDCSSYATSLYWGADGPDPNGTGFTGGYTGTQVATGHQVSSPKPGDLVIYGSGTGHHVEVYIGPGSRTAGHGSAPVDFGVIDLFGDGDYRFFSYTD